MNSLFHLMELFMLFNLQGVPGFEIMFVTIMNYDSSIRVMFFFPERHGN